jgi:ADP-heptose:LPS heptosyltransferase
MEADLKGEYHGVKGLNALYRRLVAKQFTHVADLHSVLRSEYLRMRFTLGRFKVQHIDKHRKNRRKLVASSKRKERQQLPTSFENYQEVFARLGFPVDNIDFQSIFPSEGGNLNLLPKAIGQKRTWEQWIGVAPFAAHDGKIYPLGKTLEVIKLLLGKHPSARIFLFGGGENELAEMEKWAKEMPECTVVPQVLKGFRKELILMSHLDVMLSMDSANMHLASLVAIPVVSVWGATHPYAGFTGWNQSEENCIQTDLPCRPCSIYGNRPCLRGDYACLNNITPQRIADRIEETLNTRTKQ